jgi:hypothetical protein
MTPPTMVAIANLPERERDGDCVCAFSVITTH